MDSSSETKVNKFGDSTVDFFKPGPAVNHSEAPASLNPVTGNLALANITAGITVDDVSDQPPPREEVFGGEIVKNDVAGMPDFEGEAPKLDLEILQTQEEKKKPFLSTKFIVITVSILLVCGYLLTDESFNIFSFLSNDIPVAAVTPNISSNKVPKAKPEPKKQETPKEIEVATVPENPYWSLPNPLPKKDMSKRRLWSVTEEKAWKSGIEHKFNYQRYLTVKTVREKNLKGSEEIFYTALNEKKLWTRMSAAIGLAEFGIEVDVDLVERAIGDARESLVANYFKKFWRQTSSAELYILRHAIKVVPADARLNILRSLEISDPGVRNLYLVAATYDPGRGISSFAKEALRRRNVGKEEIDKNKNIVLGVGSFTIPDNVKLDLQNKPREYEIEAEKLSPEEIGTNEEISNKVEYYIAPEENEQPKEPEKNKSVKTKNSDDDGFKDLHPVEIK